jgi:cobalamin synthase
MLLLFIIALFFPPMWPVFIVACLWWIVAHPPEEKLDAVSQAVMRAVLGLLAILLMYVVPLCGLFHVLFGEKLGDESCDPAGIAIVCLIWLAVSVALTIALARHVCHTQKQRRLPPD